MERYRALIEAHVERWIGELPGDALYGPMAYLMRLPAKRVRPALTLIGCELFGGRPENVLDEAIGIELFHNFTLMHDDIMDASPLRRGMPTVHMKWDVNSAILSGDAMLVKAYQLMGSNAHVLKIFNEHALAVCEGQQRDMDFERRADVSFQEYREMIRLKTAVLLSCALRIGACKAGAGADDQESIGAFGENLGLAFQLRDDLLDAFGDPAVTGKRRGGDLLNGKKTWLLIRGLERATDEGSGLLRGELAKPIPERNVDVMIEQLRGLGVEREANDEVLRLETAAFAQLDGIAVPDERKLPLRALARTLQARTS
ncbi:MAG TPA: polyprenyl synthetase family protein [Flavobacteriales bacterium]|nr:polyprenyl synthetase family protein [Flavobacteriales bacterium]